MTSWLLRNRQCTTPARAAAFGGRSRAPHGRGVHLRHPPRHRPRRPRDGGVLGEANRRDGDLQL